MTLYPQDFLKIATVSAQYCAKSSFGGGSDASQEVRVGKFVILRKVADGGASRGDAPHGGVNYTQVG
jgi:hypothetical protein